MQSNGRRVNPRSGLANIEEAFCSSIVLVSTNQDGKLREKD